MLFYSDDNAGMVSHHWVWLQTTLPVFQYLEKQMPSPCSRIKTVEK